MVKGRPLAELILTEEERETLSRWSIQHPFEPLPTRDDPTAVQLRRLRELRLRPHTLPEVIADDGV